MSLLSLLAKRAQIAPRIKARSGLLSRKALIHAGADPERYVGLCLILSALIAIMAPFTLILSGYGALALPGALLAFSGSALFLLHLPRMDMARRAAEIESELPFFMRSIGILTELGVRLPKAMEIAAGSEGALASEMSKALAQVGSGISLQSALSSLAMLHDSMKIKRAMAQLIAAYESGSRGPEIRRIGDELLAMESHAMREHSSKSAVFGLLFIVTSAIFPAFFLVYTILGRAALGSQMSDSQAAFAVLVLFPILSALVMLLSRASMPRFALMRRSPLDARMLMPGLVFVLGSLLLPDLQLAVMALGLGVAAYLSYEGYGRERRLELIEERLPDALFLSSGLPRSTRPERLFAIWEGAGYGPLSEEAGKTRRQLAMNVRPALALEDLWRRTGSPLLRRACLMLSQMIETGSLERMGLLAEDMMASAQIKRERAQSMAMQKYTLLFGALLLPLILKTAIGLLSNMDSMVEGGADVSLFTGSVIPAYLVIYATIASAAISDTEGRGSMAPIYFALMAGVSLAAFIFISF